MTILKVFWIFFYVNMFTIGGGYVMLPILQREIVENYQWLTNNEFLDSIAIGQITPGPLTIMNAFIGYKIAGLWGSVIALIGSYLPSLLIVTIVSKHYLAFKESWLVNSVFRGIKPAVIGLIAAVVLKLSEVSVIDLPSALIAALSFAIIAFTKTDPTFVMIGAGIAGILLY